MIEGGDDAAILQNDSSSEMPFCCKRGHSAILPSRTHFFPVHAAHRRLSSRVKSCASSSWRRLSRYKCNDRLPP